MEDMKRRLAEVNALAVQFVSDALKQLEKLPDGLDPAKAHLAQKPVQCANLAIDSLECAVDILRSVQHVR